MQTIILAIPCYNCENQIPRVLMELDGRLLDRLSEVLVIDNRSTDGTLHSAMKAAARLGSEKVRILQNVQNYGLGGTHKVAFGYGKSAGADYVAILHGDHQAKTQELHMLIDRIASEPEQAAVLGSRFMSGSHLEGYSALRTCGNIGLNLLYSLLAGRAVRDLGSGLNIFRLRDLDPRTYLAFDDGLTFNIDLLLNYLTQSPPIRFVPITWRETDQISNAKTFRVGWIALKAILAWRFGVDRVGAAEQRSYAFNRVI